MGASNLIQVINYTNPGNFTFNSNLIEVSALAQLKLQTGNIINTQPFVSSTGFTFDAAKAQFTGSLLNQVDQRPNGATFYASLASSINANWSTGVGTGTATGGTSFAGGKLVLANGNVQWTATGNASSTQVGCFRFKVTPNYSGAPAARQVFLLASSQNGGAANDFATVFHDASGALFMAVYDNGGNAIVSQASVWSPVSGTEYEIELNWDVATGATRLFIDGVQLGATATGTGSRSAAVYMVTGQQFNQAFVANFAIRQILIFPTVQHTANYTPGAAPSDTIYVETPITCPAYTHSQLGTFLQYASFASVNAGAPRFTIKSGTGFYKYWNGSAWLVSDGSYAQSNDAATLNTELPNLMDANGATIVTLQVHFPDSNTISSITSFALTILAETVYPMSNPTIIVNAGVLSDLLESLEETVVSAPVTTAIKYVVNVNGQDKWWNGTAWATSDSTYAQSSTAAAINTNAHALNLAGGGTLKLKAFLHSDDGMATPTLTTVELGYNFYNVQADPPTCTVWGFYRDVSGDPVQGAIVAFSLKRAPGQYREASGSIIEAPKQTTTDVNGRFEMDLIQSAAYEVGGIYLISISKAGSPGLLTNVLKTGTPIEYQVPTATNVNITDLIQAMA